jgi:hypothetical protein
MLANKESISHASQNKREQKNKGHNTISRVMALRFTTVGCLRNSFCRPSTGLWQSRGQAIPGKVSKISGPSGK